MIAIQRYEGRRSFKTLVLGVKYINELPAIRSMNS